jgi:hypothetical protein
LKSCCTAILHFRGGGIAARFMMSLKNIYLTGNVTEMRYLLLSVAAIIVAAVSPQAAQPCSWNVKANGIFRGAVNDTRNAILNLQKNVRTFFLNLNLIDGPADAAADANATLLAQCLTDV